MERESGGRRDRDSIPKDRGEESCVTGVDKAISREVANRIRSDGLPRIVDYVTGCGATDASAPHNRGAELS
ncbi:hypothetical protein E2C01_026496 [Portunus trituberculatus]|uniref:Uncharacterized protein n=1 Tax=Portunus trituberculatus TaxID=210409 RepID=A0A5B7EJC5_PORTR|nr:hypothetical protein [Portunus trituberculatus]